MAAVRWLTSGVALGFGAGVSPGPLLALVVAATLRAGLGPGLLVAMAPLMSDLPIVVLSLTVVAALPSAAVAGLTLAGGVVLGWFGVESLRASRTADLAGDRAPLSPGRAARQGALVNLLSPSPWLFWLTVGATTVGRAHAAGGVPAAALFLVGFYALLVGSKAAVAYGVSRARHRLSLTAYRRVLAVAGTLLLGLGVLLAVQGIRLL